MKHLQILIRKYNRPCIEIITLLAAFVMFSSLYNVYSLEEDSSQWKDKIIINEFVPIPRSGENEWIEIFNKSGEKIDLSGWKINDNTDNPKEINGEINPNSFLVLEPSPVKLNNDGDKIILLDINDKEVDMIEYGEGTVIDKYDSMNSIGRLSSGEIVVFNNPTKGFQNSNEISLPLDFTAYINYENFNLTKDDNFKIFVTNTCQAFINIKIFSENGKLEKNLVDNYIMNSGENSFLWDGRNDQGRYVNSGIYICYLKASQKESKKEKNIIFTVTNKKKRKKTGCILSNILMD